MFSHLMKEMESFEKVSKNMLSMHVDILFKETLC